jgi:hypothetical protein
LNLLNEFNKDKIDKEQVIYYANNLYTSTTKVTVHIYIYIYIYIEVFTVSEKTKTNKTFNNYSYNIIIQKVCYSYCCELQKCFSNNNAIKTNYFNSLNHSNGALNQFYANRIISPNNMRTQPMKLCTNSYSINITETNINANSQTISKSNC